MNAITITPADAVLARFGNQIAAIGTGKAHVAFARALNRTTTTVQGRVIRAVTKQSSIPRAIVKREIRRTLASTKAGSILEASVWARGKPISLKYFRPKQFSFGTKAFVQGKWRRYQSAFMGPRPGTLAKRLGGHVWVRTSAKRLPIEIVYGPAVPEELVRGESERIFFDVVASMLPNRVGHELGRMLPQ